MIQLVRTSKMGYNNVLLKLEQFQPSLLNLKNILIMKLTLSPLKIKIGIQDYFLKHQKQLDIQELE